MPLAMEHKDESESATNGSPVSDEIPKWLTAKLFKKSLKETVPNYQKVIHFEAKAPLAAGENYATIILRIRIDVLLEDGATKSLSYMMKIPQENEIYNEMMRKHNIFTVEYRTYCEIVPELEQLYRDVGVDLNFAAKCYNIEAPLEFGVILLEDLLPYGYKNANRLEGLDLEHTKAVLERLAQWHAVSARRVETKGLFPELLLRGPFTDTDRELFENNIASVKPHFLESVKTLNGHESYIESVEKAIDNIAYEYLRALKYDPNEFNVLNHGDCWSNNVMFKYDSEGKIENIILIDLQFTNYGSPAKDLLYFLLSSTSYHLKVKNFDYFIKFYHDNLVKNLKLLKYSPKLPTLKEIHMGILKYSALALSATVGVMGLALLESRSDANFEALIGTSESAANFQNAMYTNPRYKKHLEIVMPWLINRGVFELEI